MRSISIKKISQLVTKLCLQANFKLSTDIKSKLDNALKSEKSNLAKDALQQIIENSKIAEQGIYPLCQDTGLVICFVTIGQNIHIIDGDINKAIQQGVKEAYQIGGLRKSIVQDPIKRQNTKDNTPAIIYYDIVSGDKFKITVMAKGFGSENISQLKMLSPSAGIEGVKDFVLETMKKAGSKGCPPYIIGIGIGGSFEKAALLSKKTLTRSLTETHTELFWKKKEEKWCKDINKLKIGAQGMGGNTTCLKVHIATHPTHIAGLPVAINICCHAKRNASGTL